MLSGVSRKLTVLAVALSMSATPALATASAAQSATAPLNPMIALSIFGSQASAAALCGASATAATATAAATAQTPGAGCVLPVVDAPPPPPVAEAAPFVPESSGFGIAPILLGLAGIAILAALIASGNDDNDNDPPVSVN